MEINEKTMPAYFAFSAAMLNITKKCCQKEYDIFYKMSEKEKLACIFQFVLAFKEDKNAIGELARQADKEIYQLAAEG